ncbi:methyltransferase domain-containing protein [Marivivens donghaensis]|uniref:Methyltransferase domain-containing protein n=2 Tax=Marivivens donghaensis TaxID=1699413 RepID=A0ABX0VZY7_9RHOB|nr:methyltransferase domain-containing protein [Marivivens donghaensis]
MKNDWRPETYTRFRGVRLRPALDLLAQIGELPDGDVIDLGCGDGAVAEALALRFADKAIKGVDSSPVMLAKASETRSYDDLIHADIVHWEPADTPAVIFSNAALNWVADHKQMMPRIAAFLPQGGVLAVQMPGQHDVPSHALARKIAKRMFPDRYPWPDPAAHVLDPADYLDLLEPLGTVEAWETTYIQTLSADDGSHPVRRFTEATYLRPILDVLTDEETDSYISEYEAELGKAYPVSYQGVCRLPFRRVFFVLTKD